jgi:hypothetical protein
MNIRKSIVIVGALVLLAIFPCHGCRTPQEPANNEAAKTGAPEANPSQPAPATDAARANPEGGTETPNPSQPAPAPEEKHVIRIIVPAENAADVDPKLPLEWEIDPDAGTVISLNINIAEVDANGNPSPIYCAVFIRNMDPAIIGKGKWTAFEADTDKNWMFSGDDYKQLKQLKPHTKYMLEMDVYLEGQKRDSAATEFTTK